MYVRFRLRVDGDMSTLSGVVKEIGSPSLIYRDDTFMGDVKVEHIPMIVNLKRRGIIVRLWFVHFGDDLPVGLSNEHG